MLPGGSSDFTRGDTLPEDSVRLGLYGSYQTAKDVFRGNEEVDDTRNAFNVRKVASLEIAWQVDPEIRLNFTIPYVDSYTRRNSPGRTTRTAKDELDIGDIRAMVVWYPWAGDLPEGHEHTFFDTHYLNLFGGMKLPTGQEASALTGDFDTFVQTGSGALDMILGWTYAPEVTDWMRVYSTTMLIVPVGQSTSDGYRPGDELHQKIGLSVTPADEDFDWFSAYCSMDVLFRGGNTGGTNAAARRDSGGTFLNVTPGAVFNLGEGWGIEMSASIPMYQEVKGRQLVPDTLYTIGVFKTFP